MLLVHVTLSRSQWLLFYFDGRVAGVNLFETGGVFIDHLGEVFNAAAAPGAGVLIAGHGVVHDAADIGAAVALGVVADVGLALAEVVVDANVVAQLVSESLRMEKIQGSNKKCS